MPDDGEENFARLFANGKVGIGGKYGNVGDGDKKQPRQKSNAAPRPKYDGGAKYLANGVDERILRQLRKSEPEDAIDLHGMTAADAADALSAFVIDAQSRGLRDVEVIHGKGAGILKPMARKWLAECCEVLAFAEINGNSGAVRVILRA